MQKNDIMDENSHRNILFIFQNGLEIGWFFFLKAF